MKRNHSPYLLATFFSVSTFFATTTVFAQSAKLTAEEAKNIGISAYVYAYPLVTMEQTRRVMTNVSHANGTNAPMGQFANLRTYPTPEFTAVTTPNADTLYSSAWIDLSKEPIILHVPDEKGRYYLLPMLSAWTNVFASPGARTTGTKEHNFVIVGPDWHGKIPNGMTKIQAPTNLVWILGRTYCSGTPEDYKAVHAIQDQYSLTPLSDYGKNSKPEVGKVDPNINAKTSVRDQVDAMDAKQFYTAFVSLLKNNPPAKADAPLLAQLKKIGIMPGNPFDFEKLDPAVQKALQDSIKLAHEKIMQSQNHAGKIINGWLVTTKNIGTYGTHYLERALVTIIGLGANLPQDAVYPKAISDNQGKPLDGANAYVIHFKKGQLPPVHGFWSLTMYNDQYFFFANPLNRYTISQRNDLKKNPDGSIDIYIQNKNPGADKESNWLPSPTGKFNLVFRFYWPKAEILNGSWKVPPILRK